MVDVWTSCCLFRRPSTSVSGPITGSLSSQRSHYVGKLTPPPTNYFDSCLFSEQFAVQAPFVGQAVQDFSLRPRAVLESWNVCFAFRWVPDIIRSCFLSVWLRLVVLSCHSVSAGATGSCESRGGGGGGGGAWSSAEFTICELLSRVAAGGSRVAAHGPESPQNISGFTIND